MNVKLKKKENRVDFISSPSWPQVSLHPGVGVLKECGVMSVSCSEIELDSSFETITTANSARFHRYTAITEPVIETIPWEACASEDISVRMSSNE